MIEVGDLVMIKESGMIGEVLRKTTLKIINEGTSSMMIYGECGCVLVNGVGNKNATKMPFCYNEELQLICKAKDRKDVFEERLYKKGDLIENNGCQYQVDADQKLGEKRLRVSREEYGNLLVEESILREKVEDRSWYRDTVHTD